MAGLYCGAEGFAVGEGTGGVVSLFALSGSQRYSLIGRGGGAVRQLMTTIDTSHSNNSAHSHRRRESLPMSVLAFAAHQIIASWGIALSCGFVVNFVFDLLRWSGRPLPIHTFYFLLSGNPYFPVQITFGLIFGLLLGASLRRRSMSWVWVIPLAILLYAFITATVILPGWTSILARPTTFASRLSHYFGSGCKTSAHCLDQLEITMPFYTSAAYSIGVLLARIFSKYRHPTPKKLSNVLMSFACVFFLSTFVELVRSSRQGWHWSYLFIAASPLAIAAYLLLVAISVRERADVVSA